MKFFEGFVPTPTTSEEFNNGIVDMIFALLSGLFNLISPLLAAFGLVILLIMIIKAQLTRRR